MPVAHWQIAVRLSILRNLSNSIPVMWLFRYVNTTAAVKAVTDVVVTSTNARQIVESFPEDTKIIFGPDRNLGNYINGITGRKMLLWDGACHVHEQFSLEKILELKNSIPMRKSLLTRSANSPLCRSRTS